MRTSWERSENIMGKSWEPPGNIEGTSVSIYEYLWTSENIWKHLRSYGHILNTSENVHRISVSNWDHPENIWKHLKTSIEHLEKTIEHLKTFDIILRTTQNPSYRVTFFPLWYIYWKIMWTSENCKTSTYDLGTFWSDFRMQNHSVWLNVLSNS